MALTEAVGPIKTSQQIFAQSNSASADVEFVGGFINGLTGELQLDALQHCMDSADDLLPLIASFADNLKHFHVFKALWGLQKIIFNLEKAITPCTELQPDIEMVGEWASIFKRPEDLGEALTVNYFLHKDEIKADIVKGESDWSSDDYYGSGQDFALAATTLIGPCPHN